MFSQSELLRVHVYSWYSNELKWIDIIWAHGHAQILYESQNTNSFSHYSSVCDVLFICMELCVDWFSTTHYFDMWILVVRVFLSWSFMHHHHHQWCWVNETKAAETITAASTTVIHYHWNRNLMVQSKWCGVWLCRYASLHLFVCLFFLVSQHLTKHICINLLWR